MNYFQIEQHVVLFIVTLFKASTMKTINSSFLLGILNFFLYNLSLTFLSILQNPSYLEMFWKFPWPSQVRYQNILQLKG